MSEYRRLYISGGCYFFTLVTASRRSILTDPENLEYLRTAFKREMVRRPFELQAIVVMPDHLHALWQLPPNDSDYSSRWREIKKHMSKALGYAAWQKAYWEHAIRDENDWQRHLDYIHYNPVRHGYVKSAGEWQHSSFHRWRAHGYYQSEWGCSVPESVKNMCCE